jgi:ABC-type polysaccharide/polyol phosphate export permease
LVQSVYRYRWLLYELTLRDLTLRYRGSALGFAWTFLNPLLAMLVYTLVFSVYLRIPIPHYAVFLISGLLPWLWFSSSLTIGTSAIVDGRSYVGSSMFAPVILVVVPILTNGVNYLLSVPLLLALAAYFGVPIGWPILVLPVLMGIQILLTLGFLLILSSLNVFYRDLQQLMMTLIGMAFYLAPIFYPLTQVPERYRPFLFIDPIVPLILGYQNIFFYNRLPNALEVSYALVVALALCFIGRRVFNRYKDAFADYA